MSVTGKTPWVPALIAATLCSGCAGIMFDSARYAEIDNPVPRKSEPFFGSGETERWACSPPTTPPARATGADFLAQWGEPKHRSDDGKKEVWSYGETNRWCGVWIFALVPVPFLLPICDTFDRIEFVDGVAVRSASQRFVYTSLGVAIVPPFYFLARAGDATEDKPIEPVGGADPKPCEWPRPVPGGNN